MNIACASCPAKYAVPDEKVRGRKVRITCKRCGAAIIVDGTTLGAAELPGTGERPAQQTIAGGAEAPADPAPPPASDGSAAVTKTSAAVDGPATGAATAAAAPDSAAKEQAPPADSPKAVDAPAATAKAAVKPLSAALGTGAKPLASVAKPAAAADTKGAFPRPGATGAKIGGLGKAASTATGSASAATTGAARAVAVPRATAAARAVAPSALPERTWTVAVTDDDHREMTLTQLADAYAAETIDSETFVWRDGMQDWLMPFEIAEIAAALRARRLSPRTNAPADARPFGEEPAGAWREPGRWDRSDPAPDEPNFDDVTVAMEAPKAKALLQAVTGEEPAPVVPAVSKHDELTALVTSPPAVTPELLGFGLDDDQGAPKAAPEGAAAEAPPEAERKPEKLPFELAPSATPARAAIKAATEGAAEPRDLFARGANRDDGGDEAKDAPAATDDGDAKDDQIPEPGAAAQALTGARNESSVLFSLDQLTKAEAKPAPSPKKKKRDEAELLLGGSTAAAADIAPAAGGLFGQTTMAAPDFTAPPPPSVPPPAQRKSSSSAPATATPKGGGAGKWIGLVLGLAVVGGGAFFLARSPAPPPAPSATAVPATAVPAAPTATPETTATATASSTPAAAESPSGVASGAPAPGASAPALGSAAPAAGSAAATAAAPTAAAVPGATPGAAPTAATARPQAPAAPKPSAATETAPVEGPDFNKDAASAALAAAAAQAESQCGAEEGPHGTGKVSVTFVNSGRATNALVSGDFAGSALGGCVARIFRGAKVPAFGGESVRVAKTVRIP